MNGVVERAVVRIGKAIDDAPVDALAHEEPLEIRVAGEPVALTMRTPGDDRLLAIGFLYAEGVIGSIDDVGTVAACGRLGEPGYGNAIDVLPAPGAQLDPTRIEGARRGTLTTASCGVCGRRSIDDLLLRIAPITETASIAAAALLEAPALLIRAQPRFRRTGGVHAAALISEGTVLASAEDVGRHNAVDKVIGRMLYERRAIAADALLAVSGRVSFEIVQKAAAARIPIVAGVSAPTSLAVDLAQRAGITLCAFVREGRATIYSHPNRIQS